MHDDGPQAVSETGPLTRADLTAQLRELGVESGQTLLVHASMRSLGRVDGGARTVVAALSDAVGRAGNIVVSASTEENSMTSRAHLARTAGLRPEEVTEFRRQMRPFDAKRTPATGAGLVAEHVRSTPGAERSDHPQSSFAALGPLAHELMADHEVDCHHGERSPLGKLYDINAAVLLLGAGYQSCTALHLAEYRYTDKPPLWNYACVVSTGGRRHWMHYQDVALDDRSFGAIGDRIDAQEVVARDRVGQAECRLVPVRDTVDIATEWLAGHRQ